MSNHSRDDQPDRDDLAERLDAVERALTDGDHEFDALTDAAEDAATVAQLRDRVDALEARLSELDAATQALRGYVGNVRSVDRDIERRADAALAKVERLEAELGEQRGDEIESPESEATADVPDERRTQTAADEAGVARDRERAKVRTTDPEPAAATDSAADPCHCANCGAPQEREPARQKGREQRERTADQRESVSSSPRAGRERANTGRAAADGGTEEWARTTAKEGRESADSDGGFLAGLRDAL